MAVAFVKKVGQAVSIASGTTLQVVVPVAGCAQGNKLLVAFLTNSDNTDAIPTCTDNKGNVYTPDLDAFHPTNGNKRLTCFSSNLAIALVSGDTITVTSPSLNRRGMDVREASGLGPALDQQKVANSGGAPTATPSSGASPQRQYAHEFLWGVCAWGGAVTGDLLTAGAGYLDANTVEAGTGATWRMVATEYEIVAVTGTDSANGTLPGNRGWIMAVLTYPDAADVPKTAAQSVIADLTDIVTVV